MARIRTIKPEFPQSESVGRLSRDSRLLFIMMWTLADDSGRLRGNSRMLASLLFPYDDDAKGLIDGWVEELVKEQCVDMYLVDGQTYVQIRNWLIHQKIDKPSPSKFPTFDEASRMFANVRGGIKDQGKDQGSRIKDQESAPKVATVSPKSVSEKKANARTLPKDFAISDAVRTWATASGFSMLTERFEHFIGYAKANGKTYTDWDQAFINSIRGDWAKLNGRGYQRTAVTNNDNWVPPDMRALTEKLIEAERV